MVGAGKYQYLDAGGVLQTCDHWDDLPAVMMDIVRFEPGVLPEPHSTEDHAAMDSYVDKLREIMDRCRQ